MSKKVYGYVTERILEMLDKGIVPWQRPWIAQGLAPKNLISKKPYRGINTFLLGMTEYKRPWWVTYKQAQSLGGMVKKGEKSSFVVFWKFIEVPKDTTSQGEDATKPKNIPLLRYYNVFNTEQCEGLEGKIPATPTTTKTIDPIETCESIVTGQPENHATITWGGDRAAYSPTLDTIRVPEKDTFRSSADYYSTLFHEIVHSTGHESRLGRLSKLAAFGDGEYSREELVAEMGAAFLCAEAGVENTTTLENSAAYISHWRSFLKEDDAALVLSAGRAQKAVDWVLQRDGINGKEEEE